MTKFGLSADRTEFTYYDPVSKTVKTVPYTYTNPRELNAWKKSMKFGSYRLPDGTDVYGIMPAETHYKNIGGAPILYAGPDPDWKPSTQPDQLGMGRDGGQRNPNNVTDWQGSGTHDTSGDPIPGSAGTWDPWLEDVYNQYLGRSVGQEGLDYWTKQLNSGMSQQDVISAIRDGQEYQTRAAIVEMYNEFFNRNPTEQALDYWTADVLDKGQSIADVRRSLMASDEYKEKYPDDGGDGGDGGDPGGGTQNSGIFDPDYVIPHGTSKAKIEQIQAARAAAGLGPARVQTLKEAWDEKTKDPDREKPDKPSGPEPEADPPRPGPPDRPGMGDDGRERNPTNVPDWQGGWTVEDWLGSQEPVDTSWDWSRVNQTPTGGFGSYFENYDVSSQFSPGRDAEWGSELFPGSNRDFYQNQFGNQIRNSQIFQQRQQAAAIRAAQAEQERAERIAAGDYGLDTSWDWAFGGQGLPEVRGGGMPTDWSLANGIERGMTNSEVLDSLKGNLQPESYDWFLDNYQPDAKNWARRPDPMTFLSSFGDDAPANATAARQDLANNLFVGNNLPSIPPGYAAPAAGLQGAGTYRPGGASYVRDPVTGNTVPVTQGVIDWSTGRSIVNIPNNVPG